MCVTEYGFEVSAQMTVRDCRLWTRWAVGSFSDTGAPLEKQKVKTDRKRQNNQLALIHLSDTSLRPLPLSRRRTLRALLQTSAVRQLVFRIKYNLRSFHSASFTCTWVQVYYTPVTALTASPFNFLSMLLSHHDIFTNWCMYRLISLNYYFSLFFLKKGIWFIFFTFNFKILLWRCCRVTQRQKKLLKNGLESIISCE